MILVACIFVFFGMTLGHLIITTSRILHGKRASRMALAQAIFVVGVPCRIILIQMPFAFPITLLIGIGVFLSLLLWGLWRFFDYPQQDFYNDQA